MEAQFQDKILYIQLLRCLQLLLRDSTYFRDLAANSTKACKHPSANSLFVIVALTKTPTGLLISKIWLLFITKIR